MDVAYHMVRDYVARGEVTFYFLPSVDMPADGLTKPLPASASVLFLRVIGVRADLGNAGLGATTAPRPASTFSALPWSAEVCRAATMVTGRVPFAFGIGFAAAWAGCRARTAGWGMSCCCPSRRWSTEPLWCFCTNGDFFQWTVSIPSTRRIAQSALGGLGRFWWPAVRLAYVIWLPDSVAVD